MPDFPIIDAHLHVYDPDAIAYPWMKAVPDLDSAHMPEHFFARTGNVDVEAAVFIEVDAAAGRHMDEARFIAATAAVEPRIRAMVASMPLDRGADAVATDLEAFAAMPGARGVRKLIERHADQPGWCLSDAFVAGVRSLERHDLSFDLCLYHHQLSDVAELVRRCPDVRFVVDHIAKPAIREGIMDPWRADLAALAELPNVWCKISGVVTEADHAHWTPAQIRPYIDHAIQCFGFDRIMFGGDWPVCELASDYVRWVDLVDAATADCSKSEKRRLFRDNAVAFYRMSTPALE